MDWIVNAAEFRNLNKEDESTNSTLCKYIGYLDPWTLFLS